ncbi:MAG: hypothetical protein ACYCQI_13570 [Gammaproteobacteria bacterium]
MLGRRFYDPFLIGDTLDKLVSPFKPIARAIYDSQVGRSARLGFGRIFHVPDFLQKNQTEQTRLVVYESFLSNIWKYLVPVVMTRRALNVFLEKSPDFFDPVFVVADWALLLVMFGRLFLRRLVDNTVSSIILPRAISADLANYLTEAIAEGLAHSLANELSSIFSNTDISRKLHAELTQSLFDPFKKLFSENITQESFAKLAERLDKTFSLVFLGLVVDSEQPKITTDMAMQISKVLAKTIANEFSAAIFSAESAVSSLDSDAIQQLSKILSDKFVKQASDRYAKNLVKKIADFRANPDIQFYLPDKSLASCGCDTSKKLQGTLASNIYYTGVTALTFLPNFLAKTGLSVHWGVYYASFLLRALLYGQSFNEAKFSAAGLCTRHRYHVGAANKVRFLFEAFAYLADIEFWAAAVHWATEVDEFYTRDALANFLLPLHLVPTYAFHQPLMPPKKNPFDVFLFMRGATRTIASSLKSWVLPDLNDKEERKRCLQKISAILRSNAYSYAIYFLFGPSDFVPLTEWKNLQRELDISKKLLQMSSRIDTAEQLLEQRQDVVVKIDNLTQRKHALMLSMAYRPSAVKENKVDTHKILSRLALKRLTKKRRALEEMRDLLKELKQLKTNRAPLRMLFENLYMNIFFEAYKDEISAKIEYADFLRNLSKWLATPVAIFPVQGTLISMLELPIQFLNEDVSQEIFRKLQSKLSEVKDLHGAYRLPEQNAGYFQVSEQKRLLPPKPLVKKAEKIVEQNKESTIPVMINISSKGVQDTKRSSTALILVQAAPARNVPAMPSAAIVIAKPTLSLVRNGEVKDEVKESKDLVSTVVDSVKPAVIEPVVAPKPIIIIAPVVPPGVSLNADYFASEEAVPQHKEITDEIAPQLVVIEPDDEDWFDVKPKDTKPEKKPRAEFKEPSKEPSTMNMLSGMCRSGLWTAKRWGLPTSNPWGKKSKDGYELRSYR